MLTREAMSPLAGLRHDNTHHPKIEGKEIKAVPYLVLPFARKDLLGAVKADMDGPFTTRRPYEITEGWRYSQAEESVHGIKIHGAVDYHAPYGTPIAAPCDGFAIASYHSMPITDRKGNIKTKDGKKLYVGLGNFIQIYNPQQNRYVALAHFSDIQDSIPFSTPTYDTETNIWTPTNHILTIAELTNPHNPAVVRVKQGDPIGKLGVSGLRWGYDDYIKGAERPILIDPLKYKSWDEPHVHFEEMYRAGGPKYAYRDAYDLYRTGAKYPTHATRKIHIGPEPLFHLNESELPKFADE